jgi:hypothetical protein
MKKKLISLFIGVLISLLSPPVISAQYIAVKTDYLNKLNSVRVRNLILQDEVIAFPEPSVSPTIFIGGLIGVAVSNDIVLSRQKKLIGLMPELYDAIEYFDFRKKFENSLSNFLGKQYPVKVSQFVTTYRSFVGEEFNKTLSALQPNEAYLLFNTTYLLRYSLSRVEIRSVVGLAINPKNAPLKSSEDRFASEDEKVPDVDLHFNTYVYQSKPIKKMKPEQAVQYWAKNNGAAFKAAVTEGIDEIMKLILYDFNKPIKYTSSTIPEKEYVKTPNYEFTALFNYDDGNILHKSSDRLIFRSAETGAIYSVPIEDIKTRTKDEEY